MQAFIYLEHFLGPFEIRVKASFASQGVTKQGVALCRQGWRSNYLKKRHILPNGYLLC